MVDDRSLLTVASLIASVGTAVVGRRIDRELKIREETDKKINVACADRLIISAIIISVLFCVLPIIAISLDLTPFPAASLTAASILFVAYIPAVFAHYNFIGLALGGCGEYRRFRPDEHHDILAERWIVHLASLAAILGFLAVVFRVL